MAKRKRNDLIFTVCLLVYVIAFLVALAFGLNYLWDYMEAYELSRPKHAVENYMEQLTPEYICSKSADLIAKADASVQSEADCRRIIMESLTGEFTCVKNLGESTEDQTVYLIRCAGRIVGRFTIAPKENTDHGFSPWSVISDSFDLSYLLTPGHTVTVPENYPVTVNGVQLDKSHIIESGMQFPLLSEFYDTYTLPTLVTYQTGTTLGSSELAVTDPDGNPVTIDEDTVWDTLLPSCSEEKTAVLDAAITAFVQDYVDFTSCTNSDITGNYNRLKAHIVPGTPLSQRMKDAIAGLKWVSDRHAKLAGIDILQLVDIGGGKYLCDVVYRVDTRNITGSVRTGSHVKLIMTETSDGLKAETMLTC